MRSTPVPAWRSRPPFRIGEVEVRPASNEVVVDGTIVRAKPRLVDVLLRLAAAPGAVVARETLLADAWPRREVNDEVLSRAIADLRTLLRDDAREPRFIETVPKVGYRLLAPVREAPPASGASGPMPDASAPMPAPATVPMPATATAPVPATAAVAAPPISEHRSRRRLGRTAIAVIALAALAFAAHRLLRPAPAADDTAALIAQLAHAQPFSSGPDLEVGPRFSPDGRRVAFAQGRGTGSRIVVREVGGGMVATLGDAADVNLSPVFMPDGRRIAFYRATAAGECEIVAQDVASGTRERLLDCTRTPRPRFDLSRDGAVLVYSGTVRADFPAALVAKTLATGSERVLTTPAPGHGDDLLPRLSPDGTRVVFFRGTQSHRQAWLVATDGSAAERDLKSPRGLSYGAAWLGAQGPILVAADWFGQRSLNVLDVATGRARPVGARGARFPDADDAGNIVFESAAYTANLFRLDTANPKGEGRELWPSTRYTNQAEFSPDGKRVAFVSNRDGAGAVYVAPLDGEPARLTGADDYVYMRPHWSADGRAIYAVRVGRGDDGARTQHGVRIDVEARRIDVLGAFGDAVFDVRPAGPGSGLVVGEAAGNAARILHAPRDDAAPSRLPLPLASEYQVAGGRVALLQPALDGLTLCDLASRTCEPLALPIAESNRFEWLLTADAVYYRAPGASDLTRFDLARRAVTTTFPLGPGAAGASLAISPDGRTLVVAREAPLAIDLMLAPAVTR